MVEVQGSHADIMRKYHILDPVVFLEESQDSQAYMIGTWGSTRWLFFWNSDGHWVSQRPWCGEEEPEALPDAQALWYAWKHAQWEEDLWD